MVSGPGQHRGPRYVCHWAFPPSPATSAAPNATDARPDEYTALQKYISTYRDPKAADSPENQEADAKDAKKGKAWWQVRSSRPIILSPARTPRSSRRPSSHFRHLLADSPLQFWRSGTSSAATDKDAGVVPEEWLDADIKQGISNHDVESRRKRYGWNEIATEKENLFIKFLMFFTGPILYGMSLGDPTSCINASR